VQESCSRRAIGGSRPNCTCRPAGPRRRTPSPSIPARIRGQRRVFGVPPRAPTPDPAPSLEIVQVAYSAHYHGNAPDGKSHGLSVAVDVAPTPVLAPQRPQRDCWVSTEAVDAGLGGAVPGPAWIPTFRKGGRPTRKSRASESRSEYPGCRRAAHATCPPGIAWTRRKAVSVFSRRPTGVTAWRRVSAPSQSDSGQAILKPLGPVPVKAATSLAATPTTAIRPAAMSG